MEQKNLYSVQYSLQCNVHYIIQYSIHYIAIYNFEGHDKGCSLVFKSDQPVTLTPRYCLFYITLFSTVYRTVYSTLYRLGVETSDSDRTQS